MMFLFLRYFLFCFSLFSPALFATNAANIQYIVLLRADGRLGTDLDNYWNDILNVDTDLCHQAISQYPPHCTITGFFHPTHSADYYLGLISTAVAMTPGPATVDVTPTIQHGNTLDYLELDSPYVTDFGTNFLTLAHLPLTYLKGPKGPTGFDFHITLRDKTFKKYLDRLSRIQGLQKRFINPTHSAGWLIYLYIKQNDVLTQYGQPVRII